MALASIYSPELSSVILRDDSVPQKNGKSPWTGHTGDGGKVCCGPGSSHIQNAVRN